MNPLDHYDVYETVTIAGVTWSGTCTLAGLSYEMGWDVQDADGANNAALARKGRKLSKFTLRFNMIYDPQQNLDQFGEWYAIWVPLLMSSFSGVEPIGLLIDHPDCQTLEVESIVVERIGQVDLDGLGGGTVDVSCIQYAPPKPVSTKGPSGSKGSKKSTDGAKDPNDPIQQRMDTLDRELNA